MINTKRKVSIFFSILQKVIFILQKKCIFAFANEMFMCISSTMMKNRIVFMGTPDFAVESLKALVANDYNVVGVVTTPDRPIGRNHSVLKECPVKRFAVEHGINVLQPENLKDPYFIDNLREWKADLQIVVAFRMLPEIVWSMPKYGTFNLHASLLPQYRGAAPINWAIINGEQETGVTTFLLNREIDTGKIIFRDKAPILETDNAETLHNRLMILGSALVLKTADAIFNSSATEVEQSTMINAEMSLHSAPKILFDTRRINWSASVDQVHNFVRGLSPYPAAWTELQILNKDQPVNLKIFETEKEYEKHNLPYGKVVSDGKNYLKISVSDGFIILKDVQQAGKKRMKIMEYLRGNGELFR